MIAFFVGLAMIGVAGPSQADTFLPNQGRISAPKAAASLCSTYSWACASSRKAKSPEIAQIRAVNRKINRSTREISDEAQYRRKDYWALPSRRGGDCEDFALWAWVQLNRFRQRARFVLGSIYGDELNHAWVCMYGPSGPQILECVPTGFNVPIPARNAPEYLPIYSMDKTTKWYRHQR